MCQRTTCRACGKATWSGCGQHKDIVLAGVPKAQRCNCTAADLVAWKAQQKPGLFSRLFGR